MTELTVNGTLSQWGHYDLGEIDGKAMIAGVSIAPNGTGPVGVGFKVATVEGSPRATWAINGATARPINPGVEPSARQLAAAQQFFGTTDAERAAMFIQ